MRARHLLIVLLVLPATGMAAGCSNDVATCDAKASFETAVERLRGFDLEDESVAGLQGALSDVTRNARDLKSALARENQELIDQLDEDVQSLQESLGGGAEGESSVDDLQLIRTAVEVVGADVGQLDRAIASDLENC